MGREERDLWGSLSTEERDLWKKETSEERDLWGSLSTGVDYLWTSGDKLPQRSTYAPYAILIISSIPASSMETSLIDAVFERSAMISAAVTSFFRNLYFATFPS